MNIRFVLVMLLTLAFALSFVSAVEQVVSDAPMPITPVQVAPNDPSITFDLVSPNSNSVLETMTSLNVEFNFVVTSYDFSDDDYPLSCYISLSNGDILDVVLDEATGVGIVQSNLPLGEYSWTVTCTSNKEQSWTSNSENFVIRLPLAEVEVGEPSVVGNNNPSSNNDDDSGNGRRAQINLPLTSLSTTPSESQNSRDDKDSSSNGFSAITGAVVGLFGKKGALGVGIFLVVVGLVALTVYNRASLGLVKVK